MQDHHRTPIITICSYLFLVITLISCSGPGQPVNQSAEQPPQTQGGSSFEILVAETEFRVTVPEPLADGQKLTLEIVDEVTGLALNPERHAMQPVSSNQYSVKLPIPVQSVVKYRYLQEGNSRAVEYTSDGRQVRYRMVVVRNPGVVEDIISAWNNAKFKGVYGRIQGRVVQDDTNQPVPGLLVAAGGQQSLTASDGSFLLDALPPGKHNLVVYSLDGSLPAFQQEAMVAADSSTPAEIRLQPARYVNITFLVKASSDIPDGIPMRLVGNIYPLGNTFADLRGGISTIASRAPLLDFQGNKQYKINVRLPVGLDLRYKYSLGDGFWNTERGVEKRFTTRQLIVPAKDTTIEDTLNTFTTPGKGPVTFSVAVLAGMAPGETLSIQFNPFGWTEPIPMWPMGGNRWVYILYSPLDGDILKEAGYRFCKNDQCGIADDAATPGVDVAGKLFKPETESRLITYEIKQWAWISESESAITVTSEEITPRPAEFITGAEFLPNYHPSWQAYIGPAFDQLRTIRSNWVILTPTWHLTSSNPPVMASVPGQDAAWYDLSRMALLAREKGLKPVFHPMLSYYQPYDLWWLQSARDANWWQSWFDRYTTFILNHADLAAQTGSEALILGDPSLQPAMPAGSLADGNGSGVPDDADTRWTELIEKVRSRYNGKIIWRLDYPTDVNSVPAFVSSVDAVYVVLSGKLGDFQDVEPQKEALRPALDHVIGNDILLLRDRLDKPVIIGIAYPSASGAASGCVLSGDACLPGFVFEQAGLDLPGVKQSLDEQAEIYNAAMEVINQNPWIAGVVASGYYPAAAIEDKSISIRGKPALDVVWFWFDRFRGSQ